jgi:hypothetical protein
MVLDKKKPRSKLMVFARTSIIIETNAAQMGLWYGISYAPILKILQQA